MGGRRDSFDEWTLATGEMRDYGERVLWLGEISAHMKGSSGLVKQTMGSVGWDFRDGKMGRASSFLSWDQAIEAAQESGS